MEKQAEIRVIVRDAVVVAPVAAPKIAPGAAGMTATKQVADTLERSAQELVLAVSADEVAKLAEAVSLGLKLTAATRSGVVVDPTAPPTAPTITNDKPVTDFRPLANVGMIETLNGSKRQTYLYAGSTIANESGSFTASAVPNAASAPTPAKGGSNQP